MQQALRGDHQPWGGTQWEATGTRGVMKGGRGSRRGHPSLGLFFAYHYFIENSLIPDFPIQKIYNTIQFKL